MASAEWKRALRWMVGIKDWKGEHSNFIRIVKNGLRRLVAWGPESTDWALNSDRFFRCSGRRNLFTDQVDERMREDDGFTSRKATLVSVGVYFL